ncbi:MAG: hypothetical protein H0T47_23545 [Planctomycetaceae bacterium]|nr:hypothetical protein [Planctomycetaceae bacterium]
MTHPILKKCLVVTLTVLLSAIPCYAGYYPDFYAGGWQVGVGSAIDSDNSTGSLYPPSGSASVSTIYGASSVSSTGGSAFTWISNGYEHEQTLVAPNVNAYSYGWDDGKNSLLRNGYNGAGPFPQEIITAVSVGADWDCGGYSGYDTEGSQWGFYWASDPDDTSTWSLFFAVSSDGQVGTQ